MRGTYLVLTERDFCLIVDRLTDRIGGSVDHPLTRWMEAISIVLHAERERGEQSNYLESVVAESDDDENERREDGRGSQVEKTKS